MNKMCIVYLGFLILALQLSSEGVQGVNTTTSPTNTTSPNVTQPATMTTTGSNCGRSDSSVALLLLPLALTASLLHTWSQ